MPELDRALAFSLVLSGIAIVLAIGLRVLRPRDFREHAALFRAFLLLTTGSGLQAAIYLQSSLPDFWETVGQLAALTAQWAGTLWLVSVLLRYLMRHENRLTSRRWRRLN